MSFNIETYKMKKINQLQYNLNRSLRLIETIEGIGTMTGGDVKQLDEMIAGIKKNLENVEANKVINTGEQLINEEQINNIKQWVKKAKEVMNDALELANKERNSAATVTYPSFKTNDIDLNINDSILKAVSPLSPDSIASIKQVNTQSPQKITTSEAPKPIIEAKEESPLLKKTDTKEESEPLKKTDTKEESVPLKKTDKKEELKPLNEQKDKLDKEIKKYTKTIEQTEISSRGKTKEEKAVIQKEITKLIEERTAAKNELKQVNIKIQDLDKKYKGAKEKYQRWGWWD